MAFPAVLRRIVGEPLLAVATLVTAVTALTLLAAGPIYAEAVSVAALQARLEAAPATASAIQVSASTPTPDYERTNQGVSESVAAALGSLSGETKRTLVSRSFGLDDRPTIGEQTDLAVLHYTEGLDEHSELIAGQWPQTDGTPAEVALDTRAASDLGIEIGDVIALSARGPSSYSTEVVVVGEFRIVDAADQFWVGKPLLRGGMTESRIFRTTGFAVDRSSLFEIVGDERLNTTWTAWPDFDQVNPDDLEPLRTRLADLPATIESSLADATSHEDVAPDLSVTTALASLTQGATRSVAVTRANVLAVILQLALLAAYSIVHLAGWLVNARESQAELLHVRGASPRFIAAQALVEALIFAVPSALLALPLARWGVARLDGFGPLASIGLELRPTATGLSYLAVALGTFVIVALLVVPAYRSSRASEQATSNRTRQRSRSGVQRAGIDVALLILAGGLLWQLNSLGSDRTDVISGRFGVDPLLVLAPVLFMGAGAVLALRIVPFLVRGAERSVSKSRSAIVALVSWQLARRPTLYARSLLLLILAISVAVFAASYEATWTRSQRDQAAQQVGADVLLSPNRKINDSIQDLHLGSAHERLAGVARSVPILRRHGTVANSELSTTFVQFDAEGATETFEIQTGAEPSLRSGLDSLAKRRPRLGAIEVAGQPESLLLDVEAIEEERFDRDDNPLEPVFRTSVFVVIQDGNQMLHRLNAGSFASATGPATLAAPLVADGPNGSLLAPPYPISIVDIEFRAAAPQSPIGIVKIDILNLRATYEGDAVKAVPTNISSSTWRAAVHLQDQLAADSTIADTSSQPEHGRQLGFDPGWSRSPATVLVELRVRDTELPEAIPVVVSDAWLAANNSEIGDIVDLPAMQMLDSRAQIVGSIARFPTVDPRTANVMLFDLATVQMMDFDVGRPIREASEYWLRFEGDNDSLRRQLEDPPFDTVETVFKSERTDELLTDPPALGLIGALSIGAAAAAVFAVVGLLVSFGLSMRERANEFALLEALGLSTGQLGRWLLTERVLIIGVAMAIGTGLGAVMSALVLPLIALTQDGGEVIPSPLVVFPWSTIATIELATLGALSGAAGLMNLMGRRPSPAAVLRSGDGQ